MGLRIIRFRGISKETQEWVYGSLLQSEIDVNELNVQCTIVARFASSNDVYRQDIIPETVGQYTGLKDKNGKEIYEGDKLKVYTDLLGAEYEIDKELVICEVIFESGGFHAVNFETQQQFPLWQFSNKAIEITGSLHNKHLKQ